MRNALSIPLYGILLLERIAEEMKCEEDFLFPYMGFMKRKVLSAVLYIINLSIPLYGILPNPNE